ncbi:uncharacterized protein BX663DRAFT_503115 [Cokeromyces recurvatus]|uniref:uncharacterized protein n=1 Tax=Cokeromyces recurvatus TaxID=90255 RepID=UPI0022205D82|nr:uncharacterized protein BX663DRAFT_503115 [Cokeromyces recurvatus]KAI7904660.1 hypothetical protein BX663DRAFT_503115 [Cokeromyces recurvatus]
MRPQYLFTLINFLLYIHTHMYILLHSIMILSISNKVQHLSPSFSFVTIYVIRYDIVFSCIYYVFNSPPTR